MAKLGFPNSNLNPARRKAVFAKRSDKTRTGAAKGLLGGLGPARAGFRAPKPPGIPGVPKIPGPKTGGW
jgi:hypothetical protein